MLISRNIGSRIGLTKIFSVKSCATSEKSKLKEQTDSPALVYDEVPIYEKNEADEERINRLRNKSRLDIKDQNKLHGRKPYTKSHEWYHDTVKSKRQTLGRYGLKALDVTPGVAWPTESDVEDLKEYERVGYPLSLEESWKLFAETKRVAEEEIRLREKDIDEKLGNMEKWKADLQKKIEQKAAAKNAAILKKEKMMEEIRQHFGINVDPRSYKVKLLIEKKEEEEKKMKITKKKEERKAKQMQYINMQLQSINEDEKSPKEAKKEVKKEAKKGEAKEEAKEEAKIEAKKEKVKEEAKKDDPKPEE